MVDMGGQGTPGVGGGDLFWPSGRAVMVLLMSRDQGQVADASADDDTDGRAGDGTGRVAAPPVI
jgi:hypothetical protein